MCGEAAARTLILCTDATEACGAPPDPGAVARWLWDGRSYAVPCDRWAFPEWNVQAIALCLQALRRMARHGAEAMVGSVMRGFAVLPAPVDLTPGLFGRGTLSEIEVTYRELARRLHPDAGGSDALMARLNAARDAARRVVGRG